MDECENSHIKIYNIIIVGDKFNTNIDLNLNNHINKSINSN